MTIKRRVGSADVRRGVSLPLYTAEQRLKRDTSPWTFVQGVLAPIQFLVFLISVSLIVRYLLTGTGLVAAEASVVIKTLVLYTIMVTGAIWEKTVFDRYLFAPCFFWEDVFSMAVLAVHTLYIGLLLSGGHKPALLMMIALMAYATYFINAMQFVLKFRAARREALGSGFPNSYAEVIA